MGRTHATSGAALGMAMPQFLAAPVGRAVAAVGVNGEVVTELAVAQPLPLFGMFVASTGAAMLNDMDHLHATASNALGPVTKPLVALIAAISGGHRNGTHSILGVATFVFISHQLTSWTPISAGLWLGFLAALGSAALHVQFTKRSVVVHTVLCLALGVWLASSGVNHPELFRYVDVGVAVGATAHILGDMLTKEGCPLLWPILPTRFKVANITTDHFMERVVIGPVIGLVALWMLADLCGIDAGQLRQLPEAVTWLVRR